MVAALEPDGGAARAGIEAGDVLLALGPVDLYSADDIADVLRASRAGATLEAHVLRARIPSTPGGNGPGANLP